MPCIYQQCSLSWKICLISTSEFQKVYKEFAKRITSFERYKSTVSRIRSNDNSCSYEWAAGSPHMQLKWLWDDHALKGKLQNITTGHKFY